MAAPLVTRASTSLAATACRCSSLPAASLAKSKKQESRRSFSTTLPSEPRRPHAGPSTRTYASVVKQPSARRSFATSSTRNASPRNPYQVLGVDKSASASEIKRSYYQLAKKFHPDTNKEESAKARFVEIQEAYDTLGDEKKRSAFDKYGAAAQQPGFNEEAYARATSSFGGAGFGGFEDLFGGGRAGPGAGPTADIFEQMFGSAFSTGRPGRATPRETTGKDINITIKIPFLEACKGTSRTVKISPVIDCPTCSGNGLKPGAQQRVCPSCQGSGQQTFVVQNGFAMSTTCRTCSGQGYTINPGDTCSPCGGVGKVRAETMVNVDIPAGTDEGSRVTVAGKGDMPLEGRGKPGNLSVRIEVSPSKTFRRQGVNLYHDCDVPFYTAILGGRATVPTLDDDVQIKVPAGIRQGEHVMLRGRGVQKSRGQERGDLYIRLGMTIPKSLTPKQRELIQAFAADVESEAAAQQQDFEKPRPRPAAPEPKPAPVAEPEPTTEEEPVSQASAGEDEESQEDAKQEAITDSQGSEGEKKESA